MFTNPYLIALVIPLILIASGAFAKKLVRGSDWQLSDFFLGVDLSLTAMGSALLYVFDLTNSTMETEATSVNSKLTATASFLAVCFFLLLWILSAHQDWERRTSNRMGQIVWLGIISNATGIGLFAAFVILVKGVQP